MTLDDLYACFNLGFISGFPDAGRNYCYTIVLGKLGITRIELRFIVTRTCHPTLEVIRHNNLRYATKEG